MTKSMDNPPELEQAFAMVQAAEQLLYNLVDRRGINDPFQHTRADHVSFMLQNVAAILEGDMVRISDDGRRFADALIALQHSTARKRVTRRQFACASA